MGQYKYRRYERYKDSGVEWIGEIPEHWVLNKIKYLVKINLKNLSEKTPYDYVFGYIDIGSVNSEGKVEEISQLRFGDAPSRARRIISKGDTIVSTVRTYLKAIAFSDNLKNDLVCSTGFAVLTPNEEIYPKFLYRLIQSEQYINEIVKRSTGVSYPAINSSEIGNFEVFVPPSKEQKTIANFLDQKTSEINNLISDKEKLITLLKEKRQSLISELVTKGLNPDVEMKDSGVEGIGEIPEHWKIKRLKYCVRLKNHKISHWAGLDFIGLENIESWTGKIIITGNKGFGEGAGSLFCPGDILFGKLRPYLAKVVRAESKGVCSSELLVLRPEKLFQDYLFYFTLTKMFTDRVNAQTYGVKMPRANWDDIGNLPVLVPLEEEQKKITYFLDQKTNEIDDLIERTKVSIEKLKEYRQSLISEVVTGKIDVREEID